MDVIQVVCGIILSPDARRVLIVKNEDGLWSLPGGAVEPGEVLPTAIIRECLEETGLNVKIERLVSIGEAFKTSRLCKVFYFNFLATPVDPAQMPGIRMPEEILDIKWVPVEEAGAWLHYLPADFFRYLNNPVVSLYLTNPRFP